MPTMKKQILLDWSASAIRTYSDSELRGMYSYNTVRDDHSGDWLAFHDAWAGIYEHTVYDSLIDLGTPYQKIVYQIHPFEFLKFEDVIISATDKSFIYIDLDLDKYGEWLDREMTRIGCIQRGDETSAGIMLRQKHNMPTISLTAMLDSADSFVNEYVRMCTLLDINPDIGSAVSLYANWRRHRVENV